MALTGKWCINGCQDLCGLGECGMCGYVGDGVEYWSTNFVIEANEESGRYERIPNPRQGFCHCGGKLNEVGDCLGNPNRAVVERKNPVAFWLGVLAGFLGL